MLSFRQVRNAVIDQAVVQALVCMMPMNILDKAIITSLKSILPA